MGAFGRLAAAGGAAGGGGSAMVSTIYDGQSILLFTFPAMQTNFFDPVFDGNWQIFQF